MGGIRKWIVKASTLEVNQSNEKLRDLNILHAANDAYLDGDDFSVGKVHRDRHLEEVYVLAECEWLREQPTVKLAIEERGLKVHGFVFDKNKMACVKLEEKSR
jgi:carbonic anhydrase